MVSGCGEAGSGSGELWKAQGGIVFSRLDLKGWTCARGRENKWISGRLMSGKWTLRASESLECRDEEFGFVS